MAVNTPAKKRHKLSMLHHWNEDPVYGCQTWTEHPILHAQQDTSFPIGFSDAGHKAASEIRKMFDAETNRLQLVLFDMQNRTRGPYWQPYIGS
jgi:hypothetical protein